MKKLFIAAVLVIFTFPAFAVEHEFIGKLGSSYAHELENYGLDISITYMYDLDPYFVAGLEADFFWLPWEKKLGTNPGPPQTDIVASTDAYAIPVYLNAQVRLPFLERKIRVEPYVTLGLGYSMMILTYNQPDRDRDVTKFYHGFTWQLIPGVSFSPAMESKIRFTGEIGYRSLEVKNSSEKIDMSGLLGRLGVIFSI
jgi:hypothetical protein